MKAYSLRMALAAVLFAALTGCGDHEQETASSAPGELDRTVLPIAEPAHPPITEIEATKVKAPPIFEVKAPAGAPNVMVILLDNFGYAGSETFGGVMKLPTLERFGQERIDLQQLPYGIDLFGEPRGVAHGPQSPQRQHGNRLRDGDGLTRARLPSSPTVWRRWPRSCASTATAQRCSASPTNTCRGKAGSRGRSTSGPQAPGTLPQEPLGRLALLPVRTAPSQEVSALAASALPTWQEMNSAEPVSKSAPPARLSHERGWRVTRLPQAAAE